MYIGSNAKYGGIWNRDDSINVSKIESKSKMKPQEIHDYLLKQALYRFKQQGIKENISLFKIKGLLVSFFLIIIFSISKILEFHRIISKLLETIYN